MTEEELLQAILDASRLYGYVTYHTRDSRRSDKGFPDLVLVGTGLFRRDPQGVWSAPRLLFAELKSSTGKLTPEQIEWGRRLSLVPGVEYYVWRPQDLDSAIAILGRGR